jgi:hypothetical protein
VVTVEVGAVFLAVVAVVADAAVVTLTDEVK